MHKWLTIAMMFFGASAAWASKPNPAEYTITVHVVGSMNLGTAVVLEVLIDGQPYELRGGDAMGALLKLGDYQARLLPPEHKNLYRSYELQAAYEFYFPADQGTRRYDVVAMGVAASAAESRPFALPSKE